MTVDMGVMCSFGKISRIFGGARPVTTKAGQMQLTVIFSFKNTGPQDLVKPTKPCFAAAYWGFVVIGLGTRSAQILILREK